MLVPVVPFKDNILTVTQSLRRSPFMLGQRLVALAGVSWMLSVDLIVKLLVVVLCFC